MNFRLGTEKEQLTYKNKALKYLDFFQTLSNTYNFKAMDTHFSFHIHFIYHIN